MTTLRYLPVKDPHPKASILIPEKTPFLTSSEDTNMACGGCEVVLVTGVDDSTISRRFTVPVELLVKCPKCGAHNLLPATSLATSLH